MSANKCPFGLSVDVWWKVSILLICTFLGCTDSENPKVTQIPSTVSVFPEPDLSNLGETIQNQFKADHLIIRRLESEKERDVEKLASVFGRLAKKYHAFDFFPQAQFYYQKAIQLEPKTFEWHYLLARVLQGKMEHNAAKEQFKRALLIDEFHVPSLLALGEYARNSGNTKEAKTHFNNALLLDKDCVFAKFGLAQMALDDKEFEECLQLVEEALQLQPNNKQLHYVAAMAYRELNNPEKAEKFLEMHQKLQDKTYIKDPTMDQVRNYANQDVTFLLRGENALKNGDYLSAKSNYEHAIKLNPSKAETHLRYATALLNLGELDDAKREFELADQIRPGNYRIAFNLAGIALQQGNLGEAKTQLDRLLKQADDLPEVHLLKADVSLLEDDYPSALSHYSKVVELQPQNPAARVGRALVMVYLGKHKEAKATLQGDLASFPSHPSLAILMVRLLAASPDDSVRNGTLAVSLVETMAEAGLSYDLLEVGAMAYAETGAFAKAISWQEKALLQAKEDQLAIAQALLKKYQQNQPCRQPFPQG